MKKRIVSIGFGILFLLVLAPCLMTGTAYAETIVESGYCGGEGDGTNLTWTLDSDRVLTISGKGKMADYDAGWTTGNIITSHPWPQMSVSSVIIEPGVTSVGSYAFAFDYLDKIQLPEGLEKIGEGCFWCDSGGGIDRVSIPSTVKEIGGKLFVEREIHVSEKNPFFVSLDGVLFTKDRKTLLDYPCLKDFSDGYVTYNIPEGVISIGKEAFFNSCVIITEIPEGVTSIGDFAFSFGYEADGPDISTISLPSTLKNVGINVFIYTDTIFYNGTQEMWNQIAISEDNYLDNTTIYFNGMASQQDQAAQVIMSHNLSLTNLNCWYEKYEKWGVGSIYVGEQTITGTVNGPTRVCKVYVWNGMDKQPDIQKIQSMLEKSSDELRTKDGITSFSPQTVPYPFEEGWYVRRISEEPENWLFIGFDQDANPVGWAVIGVTFGQGTPPGSDVLNEGTMQDQTSGDSVGWTYKKDGTVSVTGDVSSSAPVLVATYNVNGQMLSVTFLKEADSIDVSGADTAKVFWLDEATGAPKAESAKIDLTS